MKLDSGRYSQRSIDYGAGAIFFGLMFLLAWIFFLERICYMDSASYLIEMIKKQGFQIVHDRDGAIFSQVIPVILLQFKAPLKAVMVGYSVNFIALYFLCFWFCLSICQHRPAAYTICFLLVYSVSLTFFWPVTEVFQGIIYSVVFLAWWNSAQPRLAIVHYAVACLLCILALRTHPLSCVTLLLAVLYDFLDQTDRKVGERILRLSICLVPFLYIFFWGLNESYDQAQVAPLTHLNENLGQLLNLKGTGMIWNLLSGKYIMIPGGLILLVLILGLKKKWMKLGLVISFHLSYGLLLCLAMPFGTQDLNFENLFFPFAFCQTFLIAQEFLIPNSRLWFTQVVLTVLTCIFVFRINAQSRTYQTKTAHYQAISNNLKDIPDRKLIFSSENYPHEITLMTWPSFAESLLFSGLEGPDRCFSFYVAQSYEQDWIRQVKLAEDLLVDYPWDPMSSQRKLPKHYFNLPAQPYRFLNPRKVISGDSMLTLLSQARMEWIDPSPGFLSGAKPYCKLRFYNESPDPIPSTRLTDTSVFISYRFYLDGDLVDWQPPKLPLLMDIFSKMEQLVLVDVPEQKEDIEIQFGLVGYNGDKMYLTSPRYPISLR